MFTGDLIGNKIADKITSVGKSKEKEKNKESGRNLNSTRKKTANNWRLDIVLSIKCDFYCIKMEFQKIVNLLETTIDDKDLTRFVTKNGLKFMITQEEIITMSTKKIELKY